MRLIRAHDGVAFDFDKQYLTNTHDLPAFFQLISETIQVEPDNIILMNPLGSQLTQNLLNSIINQHQSDDNTDQQESALLYVFDRHFLTADPSEALSDLASQQDHLLQPQPPPFDPSNSLQPDQLETLTYSYHHAASSHLRTTLLLLTHVRAQKAAFEVALNNLDKCREPQQGALEAYETFAQPLVHDYGQLLDAFGPSFALAKTIKIHPALLPPNAVLKPNSSQSSNQSSTTPALLKVKYMGDYVMEDKIIQIRDKCLKVYAEVNEGAAKLREELNGGDCDLEDLYELEKDADEGFRRIDELVAQIGQVARQIEPVDALIDYFTELAVLDEDSRERIACLVERKNFWLHYFINGLNKISKLQSIIPSIGVELQALNTDLKTRTDPFRYLARLKDFVTAYASTVVEVVRRREYARHLADYASALNNLVSKLANDERRRRGVYSSEYAGKLPFTVDGLDDQSIPTIEFEIRQIGTGGAIVPQSKDINKTPKITATELPPLTRADLDEMVAALQYIEESSDSSTVDGCSPKAPAREVRLLVEKQFSRLEAMENAFALAVERFVLSESESCIAGQPIDAEEVSHLKTRVAELEAAQENLTERLRSESTAAITASRKSQQETQIYIRKAEDLKLELLSVKEEARHQKERLIQDQQPLITELANASGTVEKLNERISQLEDELKSRCKLLQETERQVTSARATADDATRELHDLEARHRDHVSDHEVVLNRLQQSRDRCTELERGLADCQNRNQTLSTQVENQTQLIESRAHEAEELRARMEKELAELKARLEDEKQQNSNLRNKVSQQEIEIGHITQQSKLLTEAHAAAESRWKEESMASTSCLENHCLKAVHALKTYQQVHRTIKTKIVNMPRPGSSQKNSITTATNTTAQSQPPGEGTTSSDNSVAIDSGSNGIKEEGLPSPLSPEFEALLQSLLQFDHESMVDLVQQKLDQLSGSIRKWMKDCKGYRERASRSLEQAQVKITFRDFAKGDLALFLPTRNPSAQVWAAFNVSFPHYFLQANETVAPIIKSREWLVARIVSLTEKMVDPKEPETNPYQLPAGTRYFLLEVEPWSVEKTSRRLAQSMIGGDSPARPKMQSQMRSTTLPSQAAPPANSPLSKRRSLVETTDTQSPLPQLAMSSARIEDVKKTLPPETNPSLDILDSTSNAQVNPNVDLNQSEYTVIEHAPSTAPPEAPSDSPFRTSLSTSIAPNRSGPSGISLSLKTYQKSPLGPASPSSHTHLQPLSGTDGEQLANAPEFKPSESTRPAFLASLSLASSSAPRKSGGASTFQPPFKPRSRPVPKAHNASRSSSRAPSISSSVNLNPAVKALLKSGSPSSKGTTTVSTTFTSMEKNSSSAHPRSASGGGEGETTSQQVGLAQMMKPRTGSPGTIGSVLELAKRRMSFSSSPHHHPLAMAIGPSGTGGNHGSPQHSAGSSSGSGLFVGHSPHTSVGRVEGQSIPEPSAPVGSLHHHHHHPPVHSSPSTTGTAALGNSGFFGSWRRRKESGPTPSIPPVSATTSIPSPNPSSNNNSVPSTLQSPASASFIGASEMLKRFSGSHN
ncbi:hypothetical protein VP01_1464g1 [Puccinia sorghi]|uniref:Autophagy-related protein 11 n=1 Tax=Puccinia sorghi TaxID=27349 RepID=A0A0L6VLM7_9BASI|nr:hypothetical protein VP01_1464g1 [Puccinia sorghi]